MAFRLILDENVEHEVFHRLENYGHDVEHVDFVSELSKGTDDYSIAQYSQDSDRLIVTYDDDFVLKVGEADYRAVLYFHDASLPVKAVADVVHSVPQHYPQDEIQDSNLLGKSGFEYLLSADNLTNHGCRTGDRK